MSCSKPSEPETVWLVGAGCHDSSWLTKEAETVISQADAIVCDDLVDSSIFSLNSHAQYFKRGKRGGCSSASQEEIHQLLISLARQGKKTVRLKGGDPMIFGRGGEEMDFLEQAGIDVRLVPGISSFYAIAAKEHLALTRRNLSRGFLVVTASRAKGERSEKEWKAIADFEGTRVFLMGMRQIDSICDHLRQAGVPDSERCCIITSPVFTQTESVYASLKELPEKARQAGLKSPGIILIGGSVPDSCPLEKRTVGFVCSQALQKRIKSHLPDAFQTVSLMDALFQPVFLDWKKILDGSDRPDWLVLTSPNGAEIWLEQLKEQKIDLRKLSGLKIAVIGRQTAAVLEKGGLYADLQAEGSSQSLSEQLSLLLHPEDHVLLARSSKASSDLCDDLSRLCRSENKVLYSAQYQMKPQDMSEPDFLVFGSRQEALCWKEKTERPVQSVLICISDAAARTLEGCSKTILSASVPDAKEMADLIVHFQQDR